MSRILLYTDGSAMPNPGAGGWSCLVLDGDRKLREMSGSKRRSTNNEMELTGIYAALTWLRDNGCPPATIYSDSRYAISCIERWSSGWERKGWKKKGGPIKNLKLIQEMFAIAKTLPDLKWRWVRGHCGNLWNEQADFLAEKARKEMGAVPRSQVFIPAH